MMRSFLFIILSLSLYSCGTDKDDKLNEAILDAQIALGASDCQQAIDVLEGHGRVNTHARYLKTLASAYACRAGYSTPTFFTSDLALTATPAPLGGTTIYSTSGVTVTNPLEVDTSFVDLQRAIDLLLYAGNISATTEPTATERAKHFTSDEAGEINSQLLFMQLVQLGKYMRVYGDGNAAGVKGGGTASNTCFTSFTNLPAPHPVTGKVLFALDALTGTCLSTGTAHAQLDEALVTAATRKTRLCHGVVLLNGIFDIMPSVVGAATGGSLGAISGVTAAITAAKAALLAVDPTIGAVLTTVNQANCENDSIVTAANIEAYFALMMESVFL